MNQREVIFSVIFFTAILLTSSVSASLFSDFWGKITGRIADEPSVEVQSPSLIP